MTTAGSVAPEVAPAIPQQVAQKKIESGFGSFGSGLLGNIVSQVEQKTAGIASNAILG